MFVTYFVKYCVRCFVKCLLTCRSILCRKFEEIRSSFKCFLGDFLVIVCVLDPREAKIEKRNNSPKRHRLWRLCIASAPERYLHFCPYSGYIKNRHPRPLCIGFWSEMPHFHGKSHRVRRLCIGLRTTTKKKTPPKSRRLRRLCIAFAVQEPLKSLLTSQLPGVISNFVL